MNFVNNSMGGPVNVLKRTCIVWLPMFIMLMYGGFDAKASGKQNKKVSLHLKKVTFVEVMEGIKEQAGMSYFFKDVNAEELNLVSVDFHDASVEAILEEVLKGTGCTYSIIDNVIILKADEEARQQPEGKEKIVVKGTIIDAETGEPLIGANVFAKDKSAGTVTNLDGFFQLNTFATTEVIVITYIGYELKEVTIDKGGIHTISLLPVSSELEEVVATGYLTRAKDSFTGEAIKMSSDEMKSISNTNLGAALEVIDPGFRVSVNNDVGSNPNTVPKFEIRGRGTAPANANGVSQIGDPNQPTFILDGFEVSAETVMDLDIDRIESTTVLKDAAATALYGSRAANGVIVIETKRETAGKLRVIYNYSTNIELPDLSSYNLASPAEKLEIERLAGHYVGSNPSDQIIKDNEYNAKLYDVMRGVHTDWMALPIRNGVGHRHKVSITGGDKALAYGFHAGYNNVQGVMKGSERQTYYIENNLQYRFKNVTVRNQFKVNNMSNAASPYGQYKEYAKFNPYSSMYDANGNMLYKMTYGNTTVLNPIYEAENFNNFNNSSRLGFTNNLNVNWNITDELRLKANVGITKERGESHQFESPFMNKYEGRDMNERGSYRLGNNNMMRWESSVVLSYTKEWGDHFLNANVGGNLMESNFLSYTHRAMGFANDINPDFSWAAQYNGKPSSLETINRLAGTFTNVNYTYKGRYLIDVSARMDGSSKFGSNQRAAPFWSAGLGWNIHNEEWLNKDLFQTLRLTANYGSVGGTAFDAHHALTRYEYDTEKIYDGSVGAIIKGIGNPDLKWQTSLQRSIGVNASMLNSRLTTNISLYDYKTVDAISSISLPGSNGFINYTSNMGDIQNRGAELRVSGQVVKQKDLKVNLFLTAGHNTNKIIKVSESMDAYNKIILDRIQSRMDDGEIMDPSIPMAGVAPSMLMFEGKSLTAIYGMKSLGIDPLTGEEIFLKKNGETTNEWSPYEQDEIGDSNPLVSGSLGLNVNYKSFSFSTSFVYRFGGDMYNHTLANRVENANLYYQVDKRVFDERWREPGDVAKYKGLNNTTVTRATSRFVFKDNTVEWRSLQVRYRLPKTFVEKMSLSSVELAGTLNSHMQWSSIQVERGLNYPFAHTVSLSAAIRF